MSVFEVVKHGYNEYHFFIRQLIIGMGSIVIMWILAHIKPNKLIPFASWSLFALFLILIISLKSLPSSWTTTTNGATRWLNLGGISLSPVEFFKVGFIYYLAHSFERRLSNIVKLKFIDEIKLLIPYAIIFGVLAVFIAVLQKDLGQTLVIAAIIFMMLVFANRSWKIFALIIFLGISAFIALIVFFPHRIDRIKSWWGTVQNDVLKYFPDFIAKFLKIDEYKEAYQVGHSINAINNGGLYGEGISNGYLKLGFLGEVHTDFVLSGITEEVGFFGLLFIVMLFTYLIIRIFRVARRTENKIYHLFSIGVAVMIGTSFLINGFGTSGIIPIKGLAVPFLSYGGSSLFSSSIAIGLVLSISTTMRKVVND